MKNDLTSLKIHLYFFDVFKVQRGVDTLLMKLRFNLAHTFIKGALSEKVQPIIFLFLVFFSLLFAISTVPREYGANQT